MRFFNTSQRSVQAVDVPGLQISALGNPALKPYTSDNFDVSAELYFEPAGALSVGAFRKNIRNFIFTDTRTVGTGATIQFANHYTVADLAKLSATGTISTPLAGLAPGAARLTSASTRPSMASP